MNKVFISYSSNDIIFVNWLVEELSKEHISVWFDKFDISLGDSIIQKINEGIRDSSFFLIVLSNSSISSKWVNVELEAYIAQKEGKRIIPILIEECKIPHYLSMIQFADFRKDKKAALSELIQLINESNIVKNSTINWNVLDAKTFETLVYELLVNKGLIVTPVGGFGDRGYDFVANVENIVPNSNLEKGKYLVEAKLYHHKKLSVSDVAQVYGMASIKGIDNILLITNSTATNSVKSFITEKIKSVKAEIWDESVLLNILSEYPNIREKYFIKSNTENTKIEKNNYNSELSIISNLIMKLDNCPQGKSGCQEYEKICVEILNYLFVPPLKSPKIHSRTESGIDIRDVIYPNRCNNFNWKFIRDDYDAKYIVFEFKNYSDSENGSEIGKNEVNQLRNYLNLTIGRFGLLCSRKKPISSAYEARKQAFINERKLIIILNNDNLKEMLLKKYRNEDPSDVIIDLVDEFNLNFG